MFNKYTDIEYKYSQDKNNLRIIMSESDLDYLSAYRQNAIFKKSSKMHYMKRSLQQNGWGNDYNVFWKKRFYDEFYKINKQNIPKNKSKAKLFIKNNLKSYITTRKPERVFVTKLMDPVTEKNLPFGFSVKKIEEDFDKYIARKNVKKKFPNNPKILALKDEPLNYVVNYFILQHTRGLLTMCELMQNCKVRYSPIINKNMAYSFKQLYNDSIPTAFAFFYNRYYKNNIEADGSIKIPSIKVINIDISSNKLKSKNLVTFSEINCINLGIFNDFHPSKVLNRYIDLIDDIDVAAISGNKLYLLIKNYDKNKDNDYTKIAKITGKNWNGFSFLSSYQYLICPSYEDEDFLDYLSTMIYDSHKYNLLDNFYKVHIDEEKIIEVENLIY